MTLDPEIAEALSAFPEWIDPGSHLRDLEIIKALRSTLDILKAIGGTLPTDERVRVENHLIPGDSEGREVLVRLYSPEGSAVGGPEVPGLLFFHGGAFVLGDVYTEEARCLRYAAEAGCVVVSVDYRLAPEHPFPAAIDDCYGSLIWVLSNAKELGIDPTRLGVAGSSAGGALAAATALLSRDRGVPTLAFQLLVYPVIDDRLETPSMRAFDKTPLWTNGSSVDMWSYYLGGTGPRTDVSPYASPGRATDLTGLPPTYLMTAEFDPLRDEGIDYAKRLLGAGVATELHSIPGTVHGFDIVAPGAALSRAAVSEQVRALTRGLRAELS